MLQLKTLEMKVEGGLQTLEMIAKETELWTGADLEGLVKKVSHIMFLIKM